MARKAVELDDRDAEAHTIQGMAALFMRHYDESLRRLETALEINSNLAFGYMWGGGYRCLARATRQGRTSRKRCASARATRPITGHSRFLGWLTLQTNATRKPPNRPKGPFTCIKNSRPPIAS